MSGATVDKKGELEYPKKWYFPTYFANSVFGPNISTIDANGPFWPQIGPILSLAWDQNFRTCLVIKIK